MTPDQIGLYAISVQIALAGAVAYFSALHVIQQLSRGK